MWSMRVLSVNAWRPEVSVGYPSVGERGRWDMVVGGEESYFETITHFLLFQPISRLSLFQFPKYT
jgi:hypothetical protein